MKRVGNIYNKLLDINNIIDSYDEVIKNTRNKKLVIYFNNYKCINIYKIYNTLKNKDYTPSRLRECIIYEPKMRVIVVQNLFDKTINHLVAREILIPYLCKGLIDSNVASRKGKGTSYGRYLYFKYRNICDYKYNKYYLLKIDISKYFYSIDHDILKSKIRRKIKDEDVLCLIDKIIDSYDKGVAIGLYSSQIFSIYFLDSIDKYIKEVLKIKYYIRFQDDFILIHPSKEYLQYCLKCIIIELDKLNLKVNNKTKIYKNTENINFMGIRKNKKFTNYHRTVKKVKKRVEQYYDKRQELSGVISSINYIKGRKL